MAHPNDNISTTPADLPVLSEPLGFQVGTPSFNFRNSDPSDVVELDPGSIGARVKSIMKTAAAAATAERLESIMKTADNWIMPFQTVDQILKPYEGGINYCNFSRAIEDVKKHAQVEDRKEAIEKVEKMMERNTEIAAYAYGFYCQMIELDRVEVRGRRNLMYVRSLKKLREWGKNHASFVLGIEGCKDYVAMKNRLRKTENNDVSSKTGSGVSRGKETVN